MLNKKFVLEKVKSSPKIYTHQVRKIRDDFFACHAFKKGDAFLYRKDVGPDGGIKFTGGPDVTRGP